MSTELENTQNEESIDLNELAAAHAERDALRKLAVQSAVEAIVDRKGFAAKRNATDSIMARVRWSSEAGRITSHDGLKDLEQVTDDFIAQATSMMPKDAPKEPQANAKGEIYTSLDDFSSPEERSSFIGKFGYDAYAALPLHGSRDSGIIETVSDLKSNASKKLFIEKYGFDKYQELVAAGAQKRKK